MTDFLKIAKSIAFHFAHICAYGVETVKRGGSIPQVGILKNSQFLIHNELIDDSGVIL